MSLRDEPSAVAPLLSVSGLSKSYGGAPALSDAALDLHAGEVHALMGENGAGKSTLIRILAGVTPADRIEARLDGAPIRLATPEDAGRAGFRFVHQELNVVPTLSVAENILLGHATPSRWGLVNWRRLEARAAAALERLGVRHVSPRVRAGRLGHGDRMLIRLAAMLVADGAPPRLFVMDEPTAALTPAEADRLFAVIEGLRVQGAAILYVSHRLDEVMALADRVSVLRDGRRVMATPLGATSRREIIATMTGGDVAEGPSSRPASQGAPSVARLGNVSAGRLSGLTFDLREGEVLGVAGLEGAGQSDLLRLLLGEGRAVSGEARVLGGRLPRSPAEAWARGVGYVPRERRADGLMLGRGITANAVLPHLSRLSARGLARAGREAARSRVMVDRLRVKARGLSEPVRRLSGGNQQKVVLGRATLDAARLLLLDEPTRGVDVGARADIYAAIRDQTARGAAVLLASTDLPELIGLSNRILILRDGRQTTIVPTAGLDPAGLLSLVYGGTAQDGSGAPSA